MKKDGNVDKYGLVKTHNFTKGENLHRTANEYIKQKPDAVTFARKYLSTNNSFTLEYNNPDSSQYSKLIELVARTQGKLTSRTRNNDGNIVLQVDDGKEQSK